jgi:hypothetical protein
LKYHDKFYSNGVQFERRGFRALRKSPKKLSIKAFRLGWAARKCVMRRSLISVIIAVAAVAPVSSSLAVGDPPVLQGPRVVHSASPTSDAAKSETGAEASGAAPSDSVPADAAKKTAPAATAADGRNAPGFNEPPRASSASASPPSDGAKSEGAMAKPTGGRTDVVETRPVKDAPAVAKDGAGTHVVAKDGAGTPPAAKDVASAPAGFDLAKAVDGETVKKKARRPRPPEPKFGADGFAYVSKAKPAMEPAARAAASGGQEEFRDDCDWSRGKVSGIGGLGLCVLN